MQGARGDQGYKGQKGEQGDSGSPGSPGLPGRSGLVVSNNNALSNPKVDLSGQLDVLRCP